MTFVLSLGNADQIIQASDRRLTLNGKVVDDFSNKAGHAVCDDASFLYSFTGIARVGDHHITSRWLSEALYDAAQHGHNIQQITARFAQDADRFFQSSTFLTNLHPSDRRLTVMFTGYTADNFIFNCLISNFQDFVNGIDHPEAQREFSYHAEKSIKSTTENPTCIQAIGQFGALIETDVAELREMLDRRKSSEALLQKAIAVIRKIADRPRANGTVGKKVSTIRISHSDPLTPVTGYSSDVAEKVLFLADQVNLRTGAPKILIADAQISAAVPIIIPRVHRNAPCPCRSGKKYRDCHMKL